jgi:ABC-type transport system substrate-binding protein
MCKGLPGFDAWKAFLFVAGVLFSLFSLSACSNNPNPRGAEKTNTIFMAFNERSPRYLDPTASYSNNETPITYQVYEPLYGYHYLKRPYTLIPKTAEDVVAPRYVDRNGQTLPADAPADAVHESIHDIRIKPGILYAPHPAFAKDEAGRYRYHALSRADTKDKRSPWDFEHRGTRELVADDYVYALKRHATTRIETPISAVFSDYVVGLKEYIALIKEEDKKLRQGLDPASLDLPFLDFRRWPLEGVQALDKYTLRIRIKGKYPQWKYWLAMTFTAPVPWEADAFYAQPGMAANGLTLKRWPIGTGPYMTTVYIQDRQHVLERNPNFRGEPYPCEGEPDDRRQGWLDDCGKTMPFIDRMVMNFEREAEPLKAKFVQGFLDVPEIERTDHGTQYLIEMSDSERVAANYRDKGLKFPRLSDISNWYLGFNWYDPVVGRGDTAQQQQRNRKLRQALSIAIDWEEYSRIFPKKGGETAMGPLPAGLFGSRHGTREGVNPVTHRWVVDDRGVGKAVRRSIDEAKALLAEAGYPGGRDAASGKPLVLNYDYQRTPTPEIKAELDWMVRQFAKIGVQLEIRATDYNQFQEKMLKGRQQIFFWGWLADYPDAENFLFLLYGPNGKAKHEGENAANYENPEYDRLYERLRLLDDGPEKQEIIDRMIKIVQDDAIWAWGYFPYSAGAFQSWVYNGKPSIMVRDMVKYYRIDVEARASKLAAWNRPVWWPIALLVLVVVGLVWLVMSAHRRRERIDGRGRLISGVERRVSEG